MRLDEPPHENSRIKRVAWQLSDIQKMVEDDRYCVDALMRISAARAALARVSKILLESHIETCVTDALESEGDRTAELVRAF